MQHKPSEDITWGSGKTFHFYWHFIDSCYNAIQFKSTTNNPKNDYKLNETLSNHDNIHEGTTAVLDCLPDKLVTECIFATMTNCANKMSNILKDQEDVNT